MAECLVLMETLGLEDSGLEGSVVDLAQVVLEEADQEVICICD